MTPGTSPFALPPQAWQRLRSLVDEALAMPASARAGWLASLAPADSELRPHLEALLQAENDTLGGMSTAQGFVDATLPPGNDLQRDGTQVGPYQLLHELGRGGMATVWLAQRTDMLQSRQVALKLPHGAGLRPGLSERLQREREILATLEHPNIARLYDAGIDARGQPYIALERVDGQRIDTYAEAAKLDTPQRLRLFLQVCDAVAYAHAHLVVHRDLKPANILVDGQGQVKLLDFGIAKLLDQNPGMAGDTTREHGSALTPSYAAPEQLLGLPLGTGVDIYMLGLVLFELLTGQRARPSGFGSGSHAGAAALEDPPPRPSEVVSDRSLRQALRGDLDTIIGKALQLEAAARYATVEAFAVDLRRHLAHEPVLARKDSLAYRMRRFIRRNRLAAGLSLVAALSIAGGTTLALWQAAQARQEAAAARKAERAASAEAELASFLLSDTQAGEPGQNMQTRLERALGMVRAQYRDEPGLRGRMLLTLAINYRWIGLHQRAEALFEEAEPLLRQHGQTAALVHLQCLRASALARTGQLAESRRGIEQALALLPTQDRSPAALMSQAECRMEEAWVHRFSHEPARAADVMTQAIALIRQAGRGESEAASEAYNALARAQHESGQFAAAVSTARESIALLERIGLTGTPGFRNAWGMVGRGLRDGGRPLEAERAHGGEGRFDASQPEQPVPLRADLATTWLALHRFDEAATLLNDAVQQALSAGDVNMVLAAQMLHIQADIGRGRHAEAALKLPALKERLAAPGGVAARPNSLLMLMAEVALASQDWSEAAARLQEVAARLNIGAPMGSLQRHRFHHLQSRLAIGRGDMATALMEVEAALTLSRSMAIQPSGSLWVAKDLLLRAEIRAAQRELEAAREDAAEAASQAIDAGGQAHPLVVAARAVAP